MSANILLTSGGIDMVEQETICALSTPPGTGAIALVRISGPGAWQMLGAICKEAVKPIARQATLLSFCDDEGLIDEGLLTYFPGPNSYTGEDVAEIGVHGSPYIQQRLLNALMMQGARIAKPGEFTQRAFLNRKLDLSQAEAVADLIASSSRASHRLAQQQLKGGYSQEIAELRAKLVDLASLMELELDFGEEDVEFADRKQLRGTNEKITVRVEELINSFRLGNVLKQGVPVAIIGAPNSGKSTLLNALLGEQRAIVSDIPGTTRDAIEDTIQLHGITFRFIDTAGLRESIDVVESQGIEIAKEKAKNARIVLYLYDMSMSDFTGAITQMKELASTMREDQTLLFIANKIDAVTDPKNKPHTDHIAISAMTGKGLSELKEQLVGIINGQGDPEADIILTNARHLEAFTKVRDALHAVRKGMDENISTDLLAADMRQALHYLGEITGQVTTDELLGNIFGRFCIGK